MSLFMWHMTMHGLAMLAFSQVSGWLVFVAGLVFSLIIGYTTTEWFEKPISRRLRSLSSPQRSGATSSGSLDSSSSSRSTVRHTAAQW